jgi:hypothetical protein
MLTEADPISHLTGLSGLNEPLAKLIKKQVHCDIHIIFDFLDPTHRVKTLDGTSKS